MVKPKKYLGQHFLKDHNIARKIADSVRLGGDPERLVEIGPGTGVLTQYLPTEKGITVIEIDDESVRFLKSSTEFKNIEIIEGDFLAMNDFHWKKWAIAGNFPYNISSQIFFKVLDYKNEITEVVCMIQKEVAERIASPPGSKQYGILSVLLQAYFTIEFLFKVPPGVFHPPPKVDSAVIRLTRNTVSSLDCNEKLFRTIVKSGFQNRRKTLRNALKALNLPGINEEFDMISSRAEQLSVQDFVRLTKLAEKWSQ